MSIFDVIDFNLIDFVDILAVALLLFYLYRVLQRSRTLYVFAGIVIFALIAFLVVQVFDMKLLGGIISSFASAAAVSLVVIFQDEIRRFFYDLGSNQSMKKFISSFHTEQQEDKNDKKADVLPIVMACMNMARRMEGALIVIERDQRLDDIVQVGEVVDAKISQRLIENIFFKNSPLHDGGMIIANGRIKSAACILPVAHDYDIPNELGLRHRAALGVSQNSDAVAIVVSEQTGRISVAKEGRFHLRLTAEQLEQLITQ